VPWEIENWRKPLEGEVNAVEKYFAAHCTFYCLFPLPCEEVVIYEGRGRKVRKLLASLKFGASFSAKEDSHGNFLPFEHL